MKQNRKDAVVPAHLAETHEQYPDGFPERENDDLLGHWDTEDGGVVIVEHHPHGYEVHVNPCYDTECDACAPDRGPANPHTNDGHHFRLCENRQGPIFTVAADKPDTVLEYLARYGSPKHREEHQAKVEALAAEEIAREREIQRLDEEWRKANPDPTPEQKLAEAKRLVEEAEAALGLKKKK